MPRLPRLTAANAALSVPTRAPICRVVSPSGGSTLMTSAPRSDNCIAQNGPAMTWPRSRTRMPERAPVMSTMSRIVSEPTTTFTIEAPAAFFTINRPGAGNAMTWAMYDALGRGVRARGCATGLRAFVIRANGATFCTGTDISQFTGFSTREDGIEYERRLEACVARLERVTVPTIAQVEGIAAGAGCVIALACDLRVCTPAAKFGVPIARTLGNGLSFENCARLVEHFGVARASRLLLTGGFIDAAEAAASGAITRLADPARSQRRSPSWSQPLRAMLHSRFAPPRPHCLACDAIGETRRRDRGTRRRLLLER